LSVARNATEQLKEVVLSWKCIKSRSTFESKFMTKFRKSCRRIVIGWDGYYQIEKLSTGKYINGFATSTFRILLANE